MKPFAVFFLGHCALHMGCFPTETLSEADDAEPQNEVVLDSWPAHEATGVAPNLAIVALQLNANLRENAFGLQLVLRHTPTHDIVPSATAFIPCHRVGWTIGQCLALVPERPLEANRRYQLTLLDTNQTEPAVLWTADFNTASTTDDTAPKVLDSPCFIDETSYASLCILQSDHLLSIRLRSSEAARAWLQHRSIGASTLSHRGELSIQLDNLAANRNYDWRLLLSDAADNVLSITGSFHTQDTLAPLTISKVLANPSGPESEGEFIELHNFGTEALSLTGFSVSDDPYTEGDIIGEGPMLPAAARALVVSESFVATEIIPPAIPLYRIPGTLLTGGIRNNGETIYLRDALGRRLSETPPHPHPQQDVCLERTVKASRGAAPHLFSYDPSKPCHPGQDTFASHEEN